MTTGIQQTLPELPPGFEYRLDLARAATARDLRNRPRHRWFVFPHSYSDELVKTILNEWQLPREAHILDPFVGAGTTMVVARERGYSASGFDLSPLAVLVSNVKASDYVPSQIQDSLARIIRQVKNNNKTYELDSERLKKAFSENERRVFGGLKEAILLQEPQIRNFLMVALLQIVKTFSRAVADGGWFRWVEKDDQSSEVVPHFERQVTLMLADMVASSALREGQVLIAKEADSRYLDLGKEMFDGLITSPPYANRHDYSRIFHIELLVLGKREPDVSDLRRRSLRSHVEAQKPDISELSFSEYRVPNTLKTVLEDVQRGSDERVAPMLAGYFEDLYACLKVAYDGLKPGATAAFVVGNVRYAGVVVPVDEILTDIGRQAGFYHEKTWVIRLRGNSAQQMGQFGRELSRESVVFLRKPN